MGFESVKKEVLGMAKEKADTSISVATKKAEDILNETRKQVSIILESRKKEVATLIDQIKSDGYAKANFEVKRMELGSIKSLIDLIFKRTVEGILNLDEKTKKELTLKLLDNAEKQIEVDIIFCNKNTEKYIPKKYKVKIVDNLGGIIAQTKDSNVRIDNTFDSILEQVRKEELYNITKNIF